MSELDKNIAETIAAKIEELADRFADGHNIKDLEAELAHQARSVRAFGRLYETFKSVYRRKKAQLDRYLVWPNPDWVVEPDDEKGTTGVIYWKRGSRQVQLWFEAWDSDGAPWCELRRFASGVGNEYGELIAMAGPIYRRSPITQERIDDLLMWLLFGFEMRVEITEE